MMDLEGSNYPNNTGCAPQQAISQSFGFAGQQPSGGYQQQPQQQQQQMVFGQQQTSIFGQVAPQQCSLFQSDPFAQSSFNVFGNQNQHHLQMHHHHQVFPSQQQQQQQQPYALQAQFQNPSIFQTSSQPYPSNAFNGSVQQQQQNQFQNSQQSPYFQQQQQQQPNPFGNPFTPAPNQFGNGAFAAPQQQQVFAQGGALQNIPVPQPATFVNPFATGQSNANGVNFQVQAANQSLSAEDYFKQFANDELVAAAQDEDQNDPDYNPEEQKQNAGGEGEDDDDSSDEDDDDDDNQDEEDPNILAQGDHLDDPNFNLQEYLKVRDQL